MAARNSTEALRPARRKMKRASGLYGSVTQLRDEDYYREALQAARVLTPCVTRKDIEEIERRFEGVHSRRGRRTALLLLTLSGEELINRIKRDRDFAVMTASVTTPIDDCEKRLRATADLLRDASWRIRIGLGCRDDLESVVADCEALLFDDDSEERGGANG